MKVSTNIFSKIVAYQFFLHTMWLNRRANWFQPSRCWWWPQVEDFMTNLINIFCFFVLLLADPIRLFIFFFTFTFHFYYGYISFRQLMKNKHANFNHRLGSSMKSTFPGVSSFERCFGYEICPRNDKRRQVFLLKCC